MITSSNRYKVQVRGTNVRRVVPLAALVALLALVPLREARAAAPGPNGRIVFVSGTIRTANADGTSPTDTTVSGTSPSFSPAADKIAYVSGTTLWIMDADGSNAAQVGGSPIVADDVAWSPDGQTLAFTTGGKLYTVPIGGGSPNPVASVSGAAHPAWSPNSAKIAFDGNGAIWTVNASDGTGLTNVTETGSGDSEPTWSPDDTTIAFASTRTGTSEIWAVGAAGGQPAQLTPSGTPAATSPSWSPDGSTIALVESGTTLATMPAGGGTVTATIAGTEPDWGEAFGPIAGEGPTISGSPLAAGTTLSTTTGSWSGSPSTFGYQWLRCNSSGSGCVAISGATGSQYTLAVADGGSTLRVTVTASGSGGSVSTTSAQTGVVTSTGPTNTSLPTIVFFGVAPIQGTAVSASAGTWSGSPPIAYTYQWEQCDGGGGNCTPNGATATSYTPTADDTGHTLRVKVTATNGAGSTTAESNATKAVQGLFPAAVLPPTVNIATPVVGQTVTGSVGSWSGKLPITFDYTFEKCSSDGTLCIPLPTPKPEQPPFPSFASIPVGLDLVGWRLAFHVWATNSIGQANQRSALTSPVAANPPVASAKPTIGGLNAVGTQLVATNGTWSNPAGGTIVYSYEWQRCDAYGNACKTIPGANTNVYLQVPSDLGATFRISVTATGRSGAAAALSDHTYPTKPKPKLKPSIVTPPAIVGEPAPKVALNVSAGKWGGDLPMKFRYHWRRCDATGAHCKTISRRRIYVVEVKDVGYTLRAVVTAKNRNGALSAITAATDTVRLYKQPRGRRIVGSKGPNYLAGGGGNDTLLGRGGNDTLLGGAGDDLLEGGSGNDVLIGGPGDDRILGGPGSDTIVANDGEKDVVDCGPGVDRAVVDAVDVVSASCEKVQVVAPPTAPAPTPTPSPSPTPPATTAPTTTAPKR